MARQKKRPRLSLHPASTSSVVQPTPTPTPSPSKADAMGLSKSDTTPDQWTDEQETALFKGMIQWKPVGIHKHFRMLSISNHLIAHGHTNPVLAPHMRIPGIWTKLGQLYDLETLDEREDAFPLTPTSDEPPAVDSTTQEPFTEFTLPFAEYGPRMLERAVAEDGDKENVVTPHRSQSWRRGTRQSTMEDSTAGEDHNVRSSEPAEDPVVSRRRGTRATKKEPAKAQPDKVKQGNGEKENARRSGRRR